MSNQQVVVYTSNGCHHCDNVKSFMEEWNIPYTEKNISTSKEHYKEMRSNRVYGTPATYVGDQVILGFQKRKLKKVLNIDEVTSYFRQGAMGLNK
ncbi:MULTISPECIES: glutaredoxin family protein [Pontibacillus]|uniref:Glutaredoxin family protein n=1 Tax=Pontibacillus chungwhensis TaxID=265426 RepID=A0ABY8UZE8_9BACI|nr:glutaredoxin family protein [Pontibacillus chungwhensis]MCD5325837.1 glutaredoxin family protein [Pontibacillus sp. HN14]WIF98367.1 glutaredoxin family protein [Pontibacillus chungwhensis]